MSQHDRMYPMINIDGAIYDNQPYQFNDTCPQQWMSSSPRTVIPIAPSPTNTTRTSWTAPLRTANHLNVQRLKKVTQQQRNIDPSLQGSHPYLLPPGIQPNHPVQHVPEPIANPIARFYHQDDQPWSVLGMGMRHPGSHAHQSDFLHPHDNLGPYRQGPCSDIGSHVSPSDSGYQTLPTQSVLSIEPGRVDQELSLEVMNRAKNLTVEYSPTGSQAMARRASDQGSVSQRSTRSGNPRQQFPCPEPDCTTILKCQSEFKKHMTKHKKEWKCNVPGCKRGDEGFSTVNDLDRHKKSVHKMVMANSKSWQCAAGSCTNKHKIWPRLDNFKQHIDRMHKDENMFDLITRSEYHPQEAETVAQPLSVDPSHLLAGMGSDTALANGDPNGNTFSMNMPSFDYPSFMSISGRSNSSASQILPGTQSYDVSFLQSGTTSFNHTGGDLSVGQNFSRSTESLLAPQPSLRNSSCVSSTGKTTKPVSARGSKHNGNSKMEVPLSSAPQTKSEQLRQQLDLGKWSKAKLQKLVLQVLESHQDDDNASPGSDTCDMSKEIATILYQNFRPDRSPQRQDTQGSGSGTQRCPYKQCNFTGRNCDLNKHIKRHLKPYGCTYPKCHKRFGAKSDWKRHENSQHFQQEAFRCEYNNNRGKKCGEHYYCMEKFQEHLEEQHKINSADQIRKDLQRCKIGKNCQVQFWCGFCDSIQTLSQKRNDAWDERFDHIARHFEKDKKCIDDWICVEENKTKERIRKSVDRGAFPDNESRSSDEDREEETTMTAVMEGTAATFEMNSSSSSSISNASRKRPASAEVIESQRAIQRRKTGTIVIYCCFCGYGGSTTLQKGCMDCQHIFCKSCRAEEVASLSSET